MALDLNVCTKLPGRILLLWQGETERNKESEPAVPSLASFLERDASANDVNRNSFL